MLNPSIANMALAVAQRTTTSTAPSRHASRMPILDGMRGVASIFVLNRHTIPFWGGQLFHSYLAVDLFFILSGYVIAARYDGPLSDGSMSRRRFIAVRLLRFYPAILFSLLFAGALLFLTPIYADRIVAGPLGKLAVLGLTLLFIPPSLVLSKSLFTNAQLFTLDRPFWSLFYELIVNIGYSLSRAFLSLRHLAFLTGAAFCVLLLTAFKHGGFELGYACTMKSMGSGLIRTLFGFLLGVMLYHGQAKGYLNAARKVSPWLVLLILSLVLACPDLPGANLLFDIVAACLVFPCLVLLSTHARIGQRESRFFQFIGAASYPLYLLHQPVGDFLAYLFPIAVARGAPLSGIALAVLLVVFCAFFEMRIDEPIRRAFRRWLPS